MYTFRLVQSAFFSQSSWFVLRLAKPRPSLDFLANELKILVAVLVSSWIGQSVEKGNSIYMHFTLRAFYITCILHYS